MSPHYSKFSSRVPRFTRFVFFSIFKGTMLEDLGIDEANSEDEVVPLPNVNSAILRKVIQFCTYHKDDPVPSSTDDDENKEKRTDDITSWDADFLKVISRPSSTKTRFLKNFHTF